MKVEVELPDDIQSLWDRACIKAKDNGVLIEGNMSKGHFSVKNVKVEYSVSGKKLTATADKVPFFITKKMVEKEIKKFLNG